MISLFRKCILLWLATVFVVTAAQQTALSELPDCAVSKLHFLNLKLIASLLLIAAANLPSKSFRHKHLRANRSSLYLHQRSLPEQCNIVCKQPLHHP